MRRIAAILAITATAAVLFAFGSAAGGDEGTYEVRAMFDTGGFLVVDEEVRVAGAKVGVISEVDVAGADEAVHEDGSPEPGKAVVVLQIDDPAFHDFREDASCIIRPQSLLGEKFVECRATQPRAAGSQPPPALEPIAEGEAGEGQHLLPLENNGKAIDLDLVNNIMREPYPDRFRLILNDLGAGVAARGDDLDAVIERANPALRRTDQVLAILARQNRQLERLARDGDRVLQPLAAKRDHIGGFINGAATTAAATAERRADLEAGLGKLPGFLRELRATMTELDSFATTSTPVISDLGDAAPDLDRINRALEPVAEGGTRALRSLGNAAEKAGPDLVASRPVLGDLEDLARSAKPVAKTLRNLLSDLRTSGGYRYLMQVIFNLSGAINAFDSFGHFLRTVIPINNCVTYDIVPTGGGGVSCEANFNRTLTKAPAKAPSSEKLTRQALRGLLGALDADPRDSSQDDSGAGSLEPPSPLPEEPGEGDPGEEPPPESSPDGGSGEGEAAREPAKARSARMLLDYLLGPPEPSRERGAR